MKQIKLAVVIGLLISSVATGWAILPYDSTTTDETMDTKSSEIADQVKDESENTKRKIEQALKEMANHVNTATMVETAQKSANVTTILKADMESREKYIAVNNALATQKRVNDIKADYGGATGQGYRVCTVAKDTQTMVKLNENTKTHAIHSEQSTPNMGGRLHNRLDYVKDRQKTHDQFFCSEHDVEQKRCTKVSAYANADSNASTLFEVSGVGTTADIAKDMVRQNIMGQAIQTIPKQAGNTALGQAYLYAQNQQTALKSMPNYALSYLQAYSTINPDLKDGQGNPISAKEHAKAIVGRYYGGDESVEWVKTLIAQRPRGLLVEMANQQDLMMWQLHELNQIADLEIATMASGVLALSGSEDRKLNRQFEKLKASMIANNTR